VNDPIAAGTFAADSFLGDTVPEVVVLELVLDAARTVGAVGIGDLRMVRPLVLPDAGTLDWQIVAGALAVDGRRPVELRKRRGHDWITHATGELIDDAVADGRSGFIGTSEWPTRKLADAVHRDGLVPVRWRHVEILPTATRAHVVWHGERGRVWLADERGQPAGYIDEVVMAPPDVEAVRAEPIAHVYRVEHHEVAPSLRDAPAERVVVDLVGQETPVLVALEYAQLDVRELVFLIDDSLACAPVRGLVRSLRAERPEWTVRLVEARPGAARAAVTAAVDAMEPELVVAGNAFLVPSLVPVPLTRGRPVLDQNGTVLITGGTGALGRLMARHLVAEHGIRHLVLVSRRGPDAPRTAELVAELRKAGVRTVRVLAADVADRAQVEAALAAVDPEHPLTAVLHLAGVVDPRLVDGQDEARFRRVLAPKVDGAWHLHELTSHIPLAAFVLFSSVASVLGSAGQSNYAAANAFLDALAAHRRASGLVATSVSWGSWDSSGLSAYLGEAEVARLRRQGVGALTARQGRRIFDAAIAQEEPHLVAAPLTPPETVAREPLPAWRAAVALVRREVAVVLGEEVGPRQVLGDAGVDSLMALELRTRLTAATSVPLPATLTIDHPTPNAIARLIVARLAPAAAKTPRIGIAGASTGEAAPETVWAALEHAGIVPESLRGKRVGVFLGVEEGNPAARIAELFRVRGPAITVCGSPLVAVHLARVALLREECELAVAGGTGMVVLRPESPSDRAVLVDSALEGVGGGAMPDLVAAVVDRHWAEITGPGVRVTVEPCALGRPDVTPGWLDGDRGTPLETSGNVAGKALPGSRVLAEASGPVAEEWPGGRARTSRATSEVGGARASEVGGAGAGEPPGVVPVLVSGRDVEGLRRQASRWGEWLAARPRVSLGGVARTAALCRTHFRVRAVVLAASTGHLTDGLRALAEGKPHIDVVEGVAQREARVAIADDDHGGPCVVPALLRESPVFARSAAEWDARLRPRLGWSVLDVLAGEGELDLDHPEVVRVARFVIRASLGDALREFGVEPVPHGDVIVPLGPDSRLVRILAAVHVRGSSVDWGKALPAAGRVDLPPYAFTPAAVRPA
jgi:NAD(P)-dependent dehydrogenase (short-subunit alcohol dehydrogenase family)